MNRFSTLAAVAIALSAGLVSTASFASADEAELSAPLTTASAATPRSAGSTAGRTRAEVVAEMNAARARGEMQAGHEWGIDVPPVQTAAQKVRLAAAAAAAASVAR